MVSHLNFDSEIRYIGNRPKITLTIHGPGGPAGNAVSVLSLVDTGADFLSLPSSIVEAVGVSLKGAKRIKMRSASGPFVVYGVLSDIEIRGVQLTLPIVVTPDNTQALFGRQAMFEFFLHQGFLPKSWRQRWRVPPSIATTPPQSADWFPAKKGKDAFLDYTLFSVSRKAYVRSLLDRNKQRIDEDPEFKILHDLIRSEPPDPIEVIETMENGSRLYFHIDELLKKYE